MRQALTITCYWNYFASPSSAPDFPAVYCIRMRQRAKPARLIARSGKAMKPLSALRENQSLAYRKRGLKLTVAKGTESVGVCPWRAKTV